MIPNAEHWRISVRRHSELQHDIMGYLPGYATPRIVCDVPFVGKRWVHHGRRVRPGTRHLVLDQELPHLDRGRDRGRCADRPLPYYDPIDTLPRAAPLVAQQVQKLNQAG